jgi:hypothetical protein
MDTYQSAHAATRGSSLDIGVESLPLEKLIITHTGGGQAAPVAWGPMLVLETTWPTVVEVTFTTPDVGRLPAEVKEVTKTWGTAETLVAIARRAEARARNCIVTVR